MKVDAAKNNVLPVKASGFGSAVNGGELFVHYALFLFCSNIKKR